MSKLKIEHGVSRIKRAKLQTYIDQTIADDIGLLAEWTNNEQHYVVNELLRFALAQSEEFQKFKSEQVSKSVRTTSEAKPLAPASRAPAGPVSLAAKAVAEPPTKSSTAMPVTSNRG